MKKEIKININDVLNKMPEKNFGCLAAIMRDVCFNCGCELAEKCCCDAYIEYSSVFQGRTAFNKQVFVNKDDKIVYSGFDGIYTFDTEKGVVKLYDYDDKIGS